MGVDPLILYQLYAVIAVGGLTYYLSVHLARGARFDGWSLAALGLFFWCFLVSAIYSTFLVPQSLRQWLPAAYTVTPILTIFLLRSVGANLLDAKRGIFWVGFLGSVFIILDLTFELHVLDYYARGSAFSESRIVFFKLPAGFALLIALVQAVQARKPGELLINVLAIAATGYNAFVLTESRLMSLALLLAAGLTWLFVLRGKSKLYIAMITPLVLIPVLGFIVSRYLANFQSLDQYLADDTSSRWRVITAEHFAQYFDRQTYGLGFGFMSGNEAYNNVIAVAANQASEWYGVIGYVLALDDIGLKSALYQFGYVGLMIVFTMTLVCIFTLARANRLAPRYRPIAAAGFFMGCMMISPVSMNYFTLFYTAHLGGLLWFMASEVSALTRMRDLTRTARPRAR